ncbi:unnamed protein product [Dovyalis caffra]|uniref:Uncharacterized protein n=1 Tax=Dovyalis caffra TaxID=77055 RepID=A0AAV1RIA5_9ROSI|nr:unnamed protein product [Dovyalis caffra]
MWLDNVALIINPRGIHIANDLVVAIIALDMSFESMIILTITPKKWVVQKVRFIVRMRLVWLEVEVGMTMLVVSMLKKMMEEGVMMMASSVGEDDEEGLLVMASSVGEDDGGGCVSGGRRRRWIIQRVYEPLGVRRCFPQE